MVPRSRWFQPLTASHIRAMERELRGDAELQSAYASAVWPDRCRRPAHTTASCCLLAVAGAACVGIALTTGGQPSRWACPAGQTQRPAAVGADRDAPRLCN